LDSRRLGWHPARLQFSVDRVHLPFAQQHQQVSISHNSPRQRINAGLGFMRMSWENFSTFPSSFDHVGFVITLLKLAGARGTVFSFEFHYAVNNVRI
jgi:hypothetical protein